MQRRHTFSMLRGGSERSIQCHVIGATQQLAQFHNKAHLPQTVQYLSPHFWHNEPSVVLAV